jgi:elongation factor G
MEAGWPHLVGTGDAVEVTTPEEYMGDIVGDLQQRRAIIAKTETAGR